MITQPCGHKAVRVALRPRPVSCLPLMEGTSHAIIVACISAIVRAPCRLYNARGQSTAITRPHLALYVAGLWGDTLRRQLRGPGGRGHWSTWAGVARVCVEGQGGVREA